MADIPEAEFCGIKIVENPLVDEIEKFLDEHAVPVFENPRSWHFQVLEPGFSLALLRSRADLNNLGLKYPGSAVPAAVLRNRALRLGFRPAYWQMTPEDRWSLSEESRKRGWPYSAILEPERFLGMEVETV